MSDQRSIGEAPVLVGRTPNDYAEELQDYLKKLEGVFASHFQTSAAPAILTLNTTGSAGTSKAPALEDHTHELDLGLDTKGQVLTHTGSAYAALGVGSNDQVLTADSAQTTGLKWASGSSILALVENKDFAADATSYTFTGLDGDTDEVYILAYKIIKAVAATILTTIQPNGVTTNQQYYTSYFGTSSGTANSTSLLIGGNSSGATGGVETGTAILFAKTGVRRTGRAQWIQSDGAALIDITSTFHWTDTSTNITSLAIVCDQASGIKAGSFLRLYKLKHA